MADVPKKSRAGKINRPKSKMITSSSAAPATAFAWWRGRKPQKLFSDVPTEEDPATHLGWVKRFSLQELEVATDSFSNRNFLGRGGFGEVYKGRLADGSLVAVKRLKEEHTPGGELQFLKEVEITSTSVHRNLLILLGFCMTPTKRLLVYPFMANGSVASCLRERPESKPPLDWPTRKRIALGSARGLSYLHHHCNPMIIHRDVKAANILLDEEFEAVVGDFGLAKSIDYRETHVITAVSGTIGHIAPECLSTGKFSTKTDVYGYGIMLLELITGKRAFDLARLGVKGLLKEKKLEMLVDPDLKNNYVESQVEQLIKVALLCIRRSPMDRPMMSEVVGMLDSDELAEWWNNQLEKRWNKWQNVDLLQWEVEPIHRFSNWIIDSTDDRHAIELSLPSISEYSESPNVANGFQFDFGKPEPPSPDVLTSSSKSGDSQSEEHDVQPTFWKPTGHFQEKSQSTASVQEKSRPTVEFQEKSQPADHFQEKSLVADSFQEKSRSTADVPEKSRTGKINLPKSKIIPSSSAASATAFAWWRRHKPQKIFFDVPVEEDPAAYLGWVKRFSLRELQLATDSFSIKNILGKDEFGKVYKGRLADGSLAAVKRLFEEGKPGGELQFLKEVETTSMPMHRNVLKLQGFCMTPTERLLVYPFLANGSVSSWLRDRLASHPPLDWPTRKRIALGSARGLCYLNDYCPLKIIHRDVKAANILLDENFEAVVGVFGLAKSIHHRETHVTSTIRGTIGHIAPEYLSTGIYSDKVDVFGYGIMLLELISGQWISDLAQIANGDDLTLLDWVKRLLREKKLEILVDPDLQNNYEESEVEQLILVALLCTQGSPMDRPKMSVVVRMLEGDGLAERWNEWQKVEPSQKFFTLHCIPYWIVDSNDSVPDVELLSPR